MRCVVCSSKLKGQQQRFCSYACKVKGQSNSFYVNQKRRGLFRKNKLLLAKGGKCFRCGYDRCIRALTFHHRDPTHKAFPLDVRNCANRSFEVLASEAEKCDLLCANCHREIEDELYRLEIPQQLLEERKVLGQALVSTASQPDRLVSILRCVFCFSTLTGRQRRFCSRGCKIKGNSQKHFAEQKRQGVCRKEVLLLEKGGKCVRCGYSGCLRVLTFHHREPLRKLFTLDSRTCGRRCPELLRIEAVKCDLLCANCHAEVEEELYLKRMWDSLAPNTGDR